MLGLPDGDTDPYFDTLPDQQSRGTRGEAAGGMDGAVSPDESDSEGDGSSEVGELLQEPPELVAARRRLEAYRVQHEAGGWWCDW